MLSASGGLSEGNTNSYSPKVTALISSLSSSSSPSSSSSSSSLTSSPSPPSQSPLTHHHKNDHQTLTPSRIMEEVWKDITLSSLQPHHHHHSPSSASPALRGNGLQDFLGRPSHRDPPTPANIASSTSSSLPPHHPLTFLSLNNSGPEFHFLDDSSPLGPSTTRFQSHNRAGMACFSTSPFEALAGSTDPGNHSDVAAFGNIKKRVFETEGGSGDRRHKRMIKNRESAARLIRTNWSFRLPT
ncbi:protein FD isoform X2 [Syzygium oleosum]|uniref:protein FD isoform X2 n=1 Tax=Syzygium oleosum TaxID=219896 RepID=UPI0011D2B1CF|nr:protein FD isoform X2 [Syzygium oleosum]